MNSCKHNNYMSKEYHKFKTPHMTNDDNALNYARNISVSHLTNSDVNHFIVANKIRPLLQPFCRSLFWIICCAVCFWQVFDVFKKYSRYPVEVYVDVDEMKVLSLPAITICNTNIVSRSKLKNKRPEFGDTTDTVKYMKNLQKLLEETPLRELLKYGNRMESFITKMECYSKDSESGGCGDAPVISTLQSDHICFTYFHQMADILKPNDYVSKRSEFHCDEWGNCKKPEEPQFDTNEVAYFDINFEPHEYPNVEQPFSGRVSIHQNVEIGGSLGNSYHIEPGFTYQFFVRRRTTKMMPFPYETQCFDYFANNSMRLERSKDFTIPLTSKQCAAYCSAKLSIDYDNCWPKEFYYFENNHFESELKPFKWCSKSKQFNAKREVNDSRKHTEIINCLLNCRSNCLTDSYEVFVQQMPFPYKRPEHFTADDESNRNCCSKISIRYWSTERTIHSYSAKFVFSDFVCHIGGLVSMYVGISFITFYDMTYAITIKFCSLCRKYWTIN